MNTSISSQKADKLGLGFFTIIGKLDSSSLPQIVNNEQSRAYANEFLSQNGRERFMSFTVVDDNVISDDKALTLVDLLKKRRIKTGYDCFVQIITPGKHENNKNSRLRN